MSGPKVVRIVTREERVAMCAALLRRLDHASAVWMREGEKAGDLSDADIAAAVARREKFSALLAADGFAELQKSIPDEIAFLAADLQRRQDVALDKAARRRTRQRQGRDSAGALLQALASRGTPVPAALQEKLQAVVSGHAATDADAILAEGFALLAPAAPAAISDSQRDLARRLGAGLATQDVTAWKVAHLVDEQPRVARLDRQITELQTLLGTAHASAFAARLDAIVTTPAHPRKDLLLDSLILDLAAAVDAARAHRAAMAELHVVAAELRAQDPASIMLAQLAQCDGATPLVLVKQCITEGQAVLAQIRQCKEGVARRQAILAGFAQLGYEVREGMETAWAKDGHVIARTPSLPGYGIEIGGQADSGRMQVRTVALTAAHDTSRDKDVETIWCGDFTRLQAMLAEQGNDLVIERALGVGAVPVKVASDVHEDAHAAMIKGVQR